MSPVVREPVIWPWYRIGLRIPEARHARMFVDEAGVVRCTDVEGRDRVLAEAGAVTRVCHIPAGRIRVRRFRCSALFGLVAFWAESRPVAVLNLSELLLPASSSDTQKDLAVSGVDAVAERLGLVVEPATEAEIRRARWWRDRHLLPELSRPPYKWWLLVANCLGWILAFLVLPSSEFAGAGSVYAVLASVVLLVPVLYRTRCVGRLLSLLNLPPPAEGRTEFRVDPASRSIGLFADARLQIGSDAVVVKVGTKEHRVPGPARGGVVSCVSNGFALTFRDRRDRVLLAVNQQLFADQDAEIRAAVVSSGGRYEDRFEAEPLSFALGSQIKVLPVGDGDEFTVDGGLVAGTVLPMALWILLAGALLVGAAHPHESPVILLPIVLLTIHLWNWRRLRSWKRRQLRPLEKGWGGPPMSRRARLRLSLRAHGVEGLQAGLLAGPVAGLLAGLKASGDWGPRAGLWAGLAAGVAALVLPMLLVVWYGATDPTSAPPRDYQPRTADPRRPDHEPPEEPSKEKRR